MQPSPNLRLRLGRWRWGRGFMLAALLLGLALVAMLVGLNTHYGREVVRSRANTTLSELFRGQVIIDRIGSVGLTGITDADARVLDAEGRQVVLVRKLDAHVALGALLRSLVGDGGVRVLLPDVRCEQLEVALFDDPNAGVSLASAFDPLLPEAADAQAQGTSGPGHRVQLSQIQVAHARVSYAQGSAEVDDGKALVELSALVARVHADDWGVEVNLDSADVAPAKWPEGVAGQLRLQAGLRAPSDINSSLTLDANLRGQLNDASVEARANLNGESVHGTLQVSGIHAREWARHWPDLGFVGDSLLGITVQGVLPLLDVDVQLMTPAGAVAVRAEIAVEPEFEVHARVLADQLDPPQLFRDAKASKVGLQADVQAVLEGDTWLGSQWVNVAAFELEGQAIPELTSWGTFCADPERQLLDVSLRGSEAGLDLWAKAIARHSAAASALGGGTNGEVGTASVEGEVAIALDRPQRLQGLGIAGQGRVRAQGEWSQAGDARAELSAQLRRLSYRRLTAHDVALSARVVHDATQTQASGSLSMALAGGRIDAHARAGPNGQSLEARVRQLDLGILTDWLRRLDHDQSPTAKALAPLAGRADVLLDVRRRAEVFAGSMELSVLDLQRGRVRGDVEARVQLNANRVDGTAEARLGSLGRVKVVLEHVVPPGGPAHWGRRWPSGNMTAEGSVDLAAASELLDHPLAAERIGGQLVFDVKAARSSNAVLPQVNVDLKTHSLVVVERRPIATGAVSVEAAREAEPWAIDGVDARLSVSLDAQNHRLDSRLTLLDKWGLLAQVDAGLELPAAVQPTQPSRWRAAGRWPLRGALMLPTRPLGQLPSVVRPFLTRALGVDAVTKRKGGGTTLGLTASTTGTFDEPRLAVRGQVDKVKGERGQPPLGLRLQVDADGAGGSAQVEAAQASATLATLSTRWAGDIRNLGQQGSRRPVEVNVEARCNALPLTLIPAAEFVGAKGTVSGEVRLSGLGRDAQLSASLRTSDLNVAGVAVSSLNVTAEVKSDHASAKADVATEGGALRVNASSSVRWGARWVPEAGATRQLELAARGFELGVLRPVLGRQVNEFMGHLDAQLKLEQTAGARHLVGYARVSDGVVQVPAVGQRLSNIEALLRVDDGHLRLEKFRASGITGELHAEGNAELDAMQLRSARVDVRIPKGSKMPLTVEGVAVGDAWGKVNIEYTSTAKAQQLDVVVSKFELIAPETSAGPLQSLDERSDIRIGARRADGKFAQLPVQPLQSEESDGDSTSGPEQAPLRMHVVLGDVTVRRGTTVSARLSGALDIVDGEVAGRIEIAGGSIDVQGKRFEIENGVVTFDREEASNPTIAATARWDSPTEHSVYAQYIGDVENGRIKLYAEPPLSQDQIASLILFGTPDGTFGAQDTDQAALAVSAAGGTVAKGLNQALDQFSQLDVSARVDTSTGNPRPELVFQVSPRVATKVSRAVGEPTAGEAPDRTFMTLELRLKRFWAVSAVLGDHGATALDLIWRRRY